MFDHILALSDALKTYYTADELRSMGDEYRVEVSSDYGGIDHTLLARTLLTKVDVGKNKDFLGAIVSSIESRIDQAIANTEWERRAFHQGMWPRLKPLVESLKSDTMPTEVTVKSSNPFRAKAEVRELLLMATTPITIVDAYVGLGTLDCLREVTQPIQLLTGAHDHAIEKDFERYLKEFASEGRIIEVRQHGKLHDRYILLNARCWIVGSSLKDAGKKTFTMIELTDTHDIVMKDVEDKWKEASCFFP